MKEKVKSWRAHNNNHFIISPKKMRPDEMCRLRVCSAGPAPTVRSFHDLRPPLAVLTPLLFQMSCPREKVSFGHRDLGSDPFAFVFSGSFSGKCFIVIEYRALILFFDIFVIGCIVVLKII